MNGPLRLVGHLRRHGYHPRSDAHSNAMCLGILYDLLDHCPAFAEKAARGEVVAQLNHTVTFNYEQWNIDLAVGPPADAPEPPREGARITMAVPALVELAVEVKGVMTEHGKARKNRLRDLQAFHSHAHRYNPRTIAVGVVVVNMSPIFWSPLRPEQEVTFHYDIERLGTETVDLYRNLPLRHDINGVGLEAVSVIVISHDNLLANPNPPVNAPGQEETQLVLRPPAPQVGDPLHYATMIRRVCAAYRERWA